ncbi:hypothetical protein QBC42DRAFT_344734 [Cladorrhinum samala]|uniref:AAA+ ATPase domain-containing protein n=1 Tax=Cladorrhinum samala TaxID=585594 RepID=A0AAV9HWB7_9PEZI|nr:hypothetical protein QBC42DRAFT_344734 [Cladorrhinum samala]
MWHAVAFLTVPALRPVQLIANMDSGTSSHGASAHAGDHAAPTSSVTSSTFNGGSEAERNATVPPAAVSQFADEIQAMKLKIIEFEKLARAGNIDSEPKARSIPNDQSQTGHGNIAEKDAKLPEELEQYHRMEECLYRHRKEWESAAVERKFDTPFEAKEYMQRLLREHDTYSPMRQYNHMFRRWTETEGVGGYVRPDPFSHQCSEACLDNNKRGPGFEYDEFDQTIDYGSRRERLRKNFEWELDRLFLAEEVDRRRLEAQRMEAKKRAKKREGARPVAEPPECKTSLPRRLSWGSFKRSSLPSTERTTAIVEILDGDPINASDGLEDGYPHGSQPRKIHSSTSRTPAPAPTGREPMPERIRLNSLLLVRIMSKIIGKEATELGYLGDKAKNKKESVVFVRPFKAILYCESALRDWRSRLERDFAEDKSGVLDQALQDNRNEKVGDGNRKLRTDEEQGGESGEESDSGLEEEENGPDDEINSRTALIHLRCLISFINSDIVTRRAHLEGPECKTVHFSDLWLLFEPGTEVIQSDGKQAYRVIEADSAAHRAMTTWDIYFADAIAASNERHSKAPFSLYCIYIDFDGRFLGPVKKVFGLKRFEGERDITSLEVYPIRFHPALQSEFTDTEWLHASLLPEGQRYRHKLIRRGAKFLEVVGVRHMDYVGPTLTTGEEVESQVVVDFETAVSLGNEEEQERPELIIVGDPTAGHRTYRERDRWRRRGSDIESEFSEILQDGPCRGFCCRNDAVYDDTYIDRRRRIDYISALLPQDRNEHPSVALIPMLLKELEAGPDRHYTVSDDDLLLMYYRVFAFVLRTRKWAQLDISFMIEVQSSEIPTAASNSNSDASDAPEKCMVTAFDRLVLEKGHRPIIESLVSQHFRNRESSAGQRGQVDIIRGKGKGLILLLHGAPGVGKTSTAEGVAELFKRPLLQITCGDLGTTALEVERALETNFALASRWGCILLLDEADVFLSARTKEDFIRNGLVAAFLRVMEYYTGILFLTTNRVGDFDEAFTSRIHISLYYPELNQDKTTEVFKLNMDIIEERFRATKRKIKIDKVGIGSFASKHFVDHPHARWNGRQVRNACQTALALAEFEAQGNSLHAILKQDAVVTLNVGHFETVQKAYLEFAKYMHDLYGTSSSRRAKEDGLRAIWIDENDRVVATQGMGGFALDKKKAFMLATQGQVHDASGPQSQPTFQHQASAQHHPAFSMNNLGSFGGILPQQQQQQQQQQHQQHQQPPQQYQYYPPPTRPTQAAYCPNPTSNQVSPQMQQLAPGQPWNSQSGTMIGSPSSSFQGGFIGEQVLELSPSPSHLRPQQQQQQQQPLSHLNQGIQAMYATSGQPGAESLQSTTQAGSSAVGGGTAPYFPTGGPSGQQWDRR